MIKQFKLLIEGYASIVANEWIVNSSTCFIETDSSKIIVDPGCNSDLLLQKLFENNIDVNDINFIFITHSHIDHILNFKLFHNAKLLDGYFLYDGDRLVIHNSAIFNDITILQTPGHTNDHCSMIFEFNNIKIAIAGDVFWWSDNEEIKFDTIDLIYREDKFASDFNQLVESRKLLVLNSELIIPGHGKSFPTTKLREKL